MSTNYYIDKTCLCCGHSVQTHIGQSAAGWVFNLHVIPEQGLTDWPQWKERLLKLDPEKGEYIMDEYCHIIPVDEMIKIVENRSHPFAENEHKLQSALFRQNWLRQNHAVPGPNGLVRNEISGNCIGHGSGTWDLITGDFS